MEIKINLVPPEKKEEIKKNKRIKMAVKAEIVGTIILAVFFLVLLGFKYTLSVGLAGESIANEEIEMANQFDKIKSYNDQFEGANERIKQIAAIDQAQLYWSKGFEKISQLIPEGIEIQSLKIDGYAADISGSADTRDNLIELKSRLESSDCFSDVVLPLSNLVDKTDVEFKISCNVNDACLKK